MWPTILAAGDALDGSHQGTIPLAIAGFVLFVAAGIVRKLIKLALLVALAGLAALAFAAWRSGIFT